MKQSVILFFVLLFFSCKKDNVIEDSTNTNSVGNDLISGGSVSSFQRIIGGDELDGLYSVKQVGDGGYIFCGFTENDNASERDVLLVRTSSTGETLWHKKFSDNFEDQGWSLEITSDNGFILSCTSTFSSTNTQSVYGYGGQLIKTDSEGNQIWKRTFTFGEHTSFNTVKQVDDGGYIVSGTEFGSNKGILLKTDSEGNETWRKLFSGNIEINDIAKTNDGGFIVCGAIKSTPSAQSDIYVVRVTSLGETLWTKTYGDEADNTARSINETLDGNFIICGYNINPGATGYAKLLNPLGEQIWHSDYLNLNVQALDCIIATSDNQFVAVGRDNFGSTNKALLQKIDSNGNSVWIKWFNPRSYNLFNEVQQTSDNGFVIAGYAFGDGYIVKTDSSGN